MFDRLKERARKAAERALDRAGLTGIPALRIDRKLLEQPQALERTFAAVAASRRRPPSALDVMVGRLWPAEPHRTVLLTVDSSHEAVIDNLLEPLEKHELSCILCVNPAQLDQSKRLGRADLAQMMARGVSLGLFLQHTGHDSAHLSRTFEEGLDVLSKAAGYAVRCAATDQQSTRLLEDAARRHGVDALFDGATGLADSDSATLHRLTVGRDVAVSELKRLLDATSGQLAASIGRIKLDAARRRFATA